LERTSWVAPLWRGPLSEWHDLPGVEGAGWGQEREEAGRLILAVDHVEVLQPLVGRAVEGHARPSKAETRAVRTPCSIRPDVHAHAAFHVDVMRLLVCQTELCKPVAAVTEGGLP